MDSRPWKRKRLLQAKIAQARLMHRSVGDKGAHSRDQLETAMRSFSASSQTQVDEAQSPDDRPLQESQPPTACSPPTDTLQLTDDDIHSKIEDWVTNLSREDNMMLSIMLYETFQAEFGLGKLEAASKVSWIVHHHERTV